MKKAFYPVFLILSIAVIPTAFIRAQDVAFGPNQPIKPVVSTEKPAETPAEPAKNLTLSERRDSVATQLQDLTTKLSTYAARTQLALDRLHDKGIQTSKSQEELTLSVHGLTATKTAIDELIKIEIPETNQEKVTLEIKDSVKKIQDQLKDARGHLINALTLIKTAVTTTLEDSAQ